MQISLIVDCIQTVQVTAAVGSVMLRYRKHAELFVIGSQFHKMYVMYCHKMYEPNIRLVFSKLLKVLAKVINGKGVKRVAAKVTQS